MSHIFLCLWFAEFLLVMLSLLSGEETCNDLKVCQFGTIQACSDGLSCTDDVCNESTKSCENPTTNCLGSDDQCATDQCIESLGGCQFTCGAILKTWLDISGFRIAELKRYTNNLANAPNKTQRLGSLLEAESFIGDNYGIQMKGWLVPPVTGDYMFWIASDHDGELWLSIDDDPASEVLLCKQLDQPVNVMKWFEYPGQQSTLIPLVAGQAYFFEVSLKTVLVL